MTFSPFYMGNDTIGDRYSRNNNWGAQLNFSVPLDGGMIELCKQIAKLHEQKMRLDQALVRALKCGELQRQGFTFRPGSQFEFLCNDIVPIVALLVSSRMSGRIRTGAQFVCLSSGFTETSVVT